MNRKKINLCLAQMSPDGAEQKYIQKAFDDNWVVPMGPNVTEFERLLSQFVGQGKQVAALSSGTGAMHLALTSLGVGPGDEVCVQSFTFCASSHPIAYLGAKPVFIDSEADTWNMDPALLEAAIVDRRVRTGKYPKAIIPVALYGMPYRIDRILAVADKYGIPVVEDAAEGFGSRYDGRMLSTFGRYGVLSFNGNKMITTSGGGALVCRDRVDLDNVVYYATQARMGYPYYQHENIGFNYRLSNVCAGIGCGQMTVAQAHIDHHKHVQSLYEQLFADVPGVQVHSQPFEPAVFERTSGDTSGDTSGNTSGNTSGSLSSFTSGADSAAHSDVRGQVNRFDSNYWLCTLTLDENLRVKGQDKVYKEVITKAVGGAAGVLRIPSSPFTDCQPNANVEAMRVYMDSERMVEARPVWKPMHKQPVYCREAAEFPISDEASKVYADSGADSSIGASCTPPIHCLEGPGMVAYVNGVSERIFKVGLCLPAGPCVSDDDVRYIVESFKAGLV